MFLLLELQVALHGSPSPIVQDLCIVVEPTLDQSDTHRRVDCWIKTKKKRHDTKQGGEKCLLCTLFEGRIRFENTVVINP